MRTSFNLLQTPACHRLRNVIKSRTSCKNAPETTTWNHDHRNASFVSDSNKCGSTRLKDWKENGQNRNCKNWNNACVRYQILKPRKDSHESPIKSCTMSCKIKQRETWHCANSFPNSKVARWRKREQDSPLRNTASSNLEYRLGLENSGKKSARCKERPR